MANITITLLTNKRTRQTIDALDSVVAAQPGGYTVVEGESKTTSIDVNYPEGYASQNCYVYMKNARGEYATYTFEEQTSTKSFLLPSSMTYRGNTILVFHAVDDSSNTVWLPVIVPVSATGVDYRKVAAASDDLLQKVLRELESTCTLVDEAHTAINALIQPPDYSTANRVGQAKVSITEDGRLKFSDIKGEKGDDGEKGDTGDTGPEGPQGKDSMWITGFTVSETDGHLYGLSTRELDSLPYRLDPYTGHLLMGIQRKGA